MPPRPRPALSPPQVQLDQAKNDITQRQAQPDDARLKSTAVEKQLIDAKSGAAQLLLGNWICGGGILQAPRCLYLDRNRRVVTNADCWDLRHCHQRTDPVHLPPTHPRETEDAGGKLKGQQ
jgi:hypothetical protein